MYMNRLSACIICAQASFFCWLECGWGGLWQRSRPNSSIRRTVKEQTEEQATTAASPAAAAEDASEWAAKKERMRQELMSCVGNDASQQRRMLKELSDELGE